MTNSLRFLEQYFLGTYIKHQDTALENKFLVRKLFIILQLLRCGVG